MKFLQKLLLSPRLLLRLQLYLVCFCRILGFIFKKGPSLDYSKICCGSKAPLAPASPLVAWVERWSLWRMSLRILHFKNFICMMHLIEFACAFENSFPGNIKYIILPPRCTEVYEISRYPPLWGGCAPDPANLIPLVAK